MQVGSGLLWGCRRYLWNSRNVPLKFQSRSICQTPHGQSPLSICWLKWLDACKLSLEVRSQHACYWWILIFEHCKQIRHHVNIILSVFQVKTLPLFFWTAWELCSHAKSLPSGPYWTYRFVSTTHAMKKPIYLYHYNALNCIKLQFNHPLFANKMDYVLHHIFMDAEHHVRMYNEWMSSDGCWEMQVNTCPLQKLQVHVLTTHARYHYLLVPHCAVLFCYQIKHISPICVEARLHIPYWSV